jgi:DNA-binding SARP family transcriptional activator
MEPGWTAGGLLRASRARAGLTQRQLAERSGVSIRTVRGLENNTVGRPQAASLHRLAVVLGLDPARLAAPPGEAAAESDTGPLRVDVLGPLAVRRGQQTITLASPLHRTLLGLLAIQPQRDVAIDEIIDTLWEAAPPRTCRELVHTYSGAVRRLLSAPGTGPVLVRGTQGYRLLLDTGQSDAADFGSLLTRAGQAAAEHAVLSAWQLYTEALACWRGPLLAGVGPWPQRQPAAIALTGQRTSAALAWADLGLRLARYRELIPALGALGASQPLHEGLAARLMLALAGAGQQAEALAVYDRLRDRLAAELGIDPGSELRSAQLRVLRGQLPEPVVTVAAATPPPAQLPTDCAEFTGRAAELAALDRLLTADPAARAAPVVVLTGMGGVGKTALAVRWARREQARYPDGQLYADLRGHGVTGPVRPLQVLAGFLAALGERTERIPDDEGQAAALLRTRLAGRRILILLDNALDAEQVRPLLPAAPGSAAIVTARSRLTGLVARDGAGLLAVRPLPAHDASALLASVLGDRGSAEPPETLAELAGLCAHLPLALRIAAANLAARPDYRLADYAAKLAAGDRLTGLAIAEDPQTAVRSTFELSCDALKPEHRRMFRLAGLVPGGTLTPADAAALADITPGLAESLLDLLSVRSLVDEYTPGRYRLHDLLRLYAAELAAAEETTADRVAALDRLARATLAALRRAAALLYPHLLHLPDEEDAEPAGSSPTLADSQAALAWLDAEQANVVALIVRLGETGRHALAWRLADRLTGYLHLRMKTVDGLTAARAARHAAIAVGDPAAMANAELQLGMLDDALSRHEEAARHFAAAARIARQAGWTACEATALNNLARAHWTAGRASQTIEYLNAALDLHRRSGRMAGEAVTLANLATARLELARSAEADGDHASARLDRHEAVRQLGTALEMHETLGDRRNEADTRRVLAEAHRDLGQIGPAADYVRQALQLAQEAADLRFEAASRNTLATIQARLGERDSCLAGHRRAQDLARQAGDSRQQADILVDLAGSLILLGRPREALLAVQDATAIAGKIGSPLIRRRCEYLLAALTRQHPGR